MANFYTSDLHHAHKNILNFTERRKFTTVDNHTDWLVETWNKQVQPCDHVYHLGDLSFSSNYDEIVDFVYKLNGQIHLIQGNHDNLKVLSRLVQEGYAVWSGTYKETKLDSTKVCLLHYPITIWNRKQNGSYHLFGHCHSSYVPPNGKSLDVGIDNAYSLLGQHRLFNEQDIRDYMATRKSVQLDHHKER